MDSALEAVLIGWRAKEIYADKSVVGLDTAKNVFQLHGVDRDGKLTFNKWLRRAQLTDFFANLPRCVIGLEATQGAYHWARVLETFGHTVRLVAPQFVKPYLSLRQNYTVLSEQSARI